MRTEFLKAFLRDESGAVTVDWVVLTGALVALGMIVITTISGGLETGANSISDGIASVPQFNEFPTRTTP
jgi:Flp pilus assembly pilin Flp